MRIVLANWAHVWDGAASGGGVNGYAQGLALELRDRGHEIAWLSSGLTFAGGPPRLVRHPDWLGIRVFEVIDSPVLAPSIAQFQDPAGEVSSPVLEGLVHDCIAGLRAEIVHFHNVEGFTAGCLAAAKRAGAAVLFSLHNYHPVCPQVYLMRGHTSPCTNSEGGYACAGCIQAPDPATERAARTPRAEARPAALSAPMRRWRTRGLPEIPPREPPGPNPGLPPWIEAGGPESFARDYRLPEDARGRTRLVESERAPRRLHLPESVDWRPAENDARPEPPDPRPPNAYALRRRAMVDALNGCDRVLAVSTFVREKFVSLGVRPEVIVRQPIGTRMVDIARRHEELLFDPGGFEGGRPLRLVFMGFNNAYKGLGMVADALELLVPELLAQIDLSVFALEGQPIEWRFRRLEPRLARLHVNHGYEAHDVPWMLGGKDIGLVASIWWDNAPQTVFEYQACGVPVVGPRLGGIPDFIRHGEDGLLFRGNDRYDLARTLARLLADRELVRRLRRGVRPPRTMEAHGSELEQTYRQCVSCPGPSRA